MGEYSHIYTATQVQSTKLPTELNKLTENRISCNIAGAILSNLIYKIHNKIMRIQVHLCLPANGVVWRRLGAHKLYVCSAVWRDL